MKILCGGDLHCWHTNYDQTDQAGESSRLADWRRSAEALVHTAIWRGVDVAVFPGDLFTTSRPPVRAVLEVAELFRRFEVQSAPVVACQGNHDAPAPGQPGPVDLLAAIDEGDGLWGITKPALVDVAGLQVAVLPWIKPGVLLNGEDTPTDVIAACRERLLAIARGLAAQVDPRRPAILIGHWAVEGCLTSSGMSLLGQSEVTLPLGELQSLPFGAVIMGHIHHNQLFPGSPLVMHTGAVERLDFGEEKDPRGCYILDTDAWTAEWVELPARRFVTLKPHAPLTDSTIQEAFDPLPAAALDSVRDAIVRVTYRGTEEAVKRGDHGAVIRLLQEAGAHLVAGVFPEVERGERSRDAGTTEDTSPATALERWLDRRSDLSPEVRAKVLAAGLTLIGEVA